MADIHSIKESISEMSESSAIALLLDIREARRSAMTRRRQKKKKKKSKKKKGPSKKKMAKTINSMTAEQKLLLLKQLKGE